MTLLNEMLTNEDVNLWDSGVDAVDEVIKAASKSDLEQLIIKFEGHQLFRSETFICYETHASMSEEEYFDILDEHDL